MIVAANYLYLRKTIFKFSRNKSIDWKSDLEIQLLLSVIFLITLFIDRDKRASEAE
jgi:hypothetical protein